MKHDILAEKFGTRLRPVRMEDAPFIVELRNSPHAVKFLGDSAKTVPEQENWLQAYFQRQDDYTFVIEVSEGSKPVGMLGIYDIQDDTGEWGRWVIQPGVMAGPASAWLALHICYEVVGLDKVRGLVVEANKQVISFHRRAGYVEKGFHPVARVIGGQEVRMVEFVTTRSDWSRVSKTLEQSALMAQKFATC